MSLSWRRLLFGEPLATHEGHHQRLPKFVALPVFSSDAISSVAYATEEILLALTLGGVAGAVALHTVFPVSLAIAALLAIVVFSYHQTIHAYPSGGGSYIVAKENLGVLPGLTAGAALLIDYILTVAVSVSAGVAAILSAFGGLEPHRVGLCVGFVALITVANLRGLKESGLVFMVPTYGFLLCLYTLIGVGLVKLLTGTVPGPLPGAEHDPATGAATALTPLLVLRAFSSGCAAMTGTEAVSNGVPAFQKPESRNASQTLFWMAGILATLFMGTSFLAWKYGAIPDHTHSSTVLSLLTEAVFGRGAFYYVTQVFTCAILIVAANTAFADFPRLTMLLAQDRFLPKQLANIGDRLVYNNGIVALAVVASLLIVAFGGITHHLIPLYAVGVFLSFTLSQAGMVRHWLRTRSPGWQRSAGVNGAGALCTVVVLGVIGYTKFTAGEPIRLFPLTTPLGFFAAAAAIGGALLSMYHRWMAHWFLGLVTAGFLVYWIATRDALLRPLDLHMGAWVVVAVIPMMVWMFFRIYRHYQYVAEHLTMERYRPHKFRHTVLVLVSGVHRGIMPALEYARSLGGDVRAVSVETDPDRTPQLVKRWSEWVPDIPLVVVDSPYRALAGPLVQYLESVERERDDDVVTLILPEFVTDRWWTKLLHNQSGLQLKWALLFTKGVVVTNIRYHLDEETDDALGDHPLTSVLD